VCPVCEAQTGHVHARAYQVAQGRIGV